MNNAITNLVGKSCKIECEDNYYEAVIKDIKGDWIVVEEDDETIYLNSYKVRSITPVEDTASAKKSGLFKRKNDMMED